MGGGVRTEGQCQHVWPLVPRGGGGARAASKAADLEKPLSEQEHQGRWQGEWGSLSSCSACSLTSICGIHQLNNYFPLLSQVIQPWLFSSASLDSTVLRGPPFHPPRKPFLGMPAFSVGTIPVHSWRVGACDPQPQACENIMAMRLW